MKLDQFIKRALAIAWQRLQKETASIDVELFDESTFRFLFLTALRKLDKNAVCRTEWNGRVDMHAQHTNERAAIEFKFYVYRFHYDREQRRLHRKGGPGPKNAGEFSKCLDKLAKLSSPDIDRKYLIVVYQEDKFENWKYSYKQSYDDITASHLVPNKCEVQCEHTMASFRTRTERPASENSKTICCKLIEVA